jgi:hypothetical protein
METYSVVCGACGTPAEGNDDLAPDDVVTCGGCGQSDAYSAILESAKSYATAAVARRLQTSMADAVRGSKYVKYEAGHIPARAYRWILADID